MFGDGPLAFAEFAMGEATPLATIHAAVFELLRGRADVVVFGAQAVNAYVDDPRMTEDVDVLCTQPAALAEALCAELSRRFHIAVRSREVAGGKGIRIYQARKPKHRHLVDVRGVDELPPHGLIEGVAVLAAPELVAYKVISHTARKTTAKGAKDLADLRLLLLAFPELKQVDGEVLARLTALGAAGAAAETWAELATAPIAADDDDD